MFTKHFTRLVSREQLDNDDVELFYDIVQSVVSTKVVTAYDTDKDEVSVDVIAYEDSDEDGDLFVYEIVLSEEIAPSEGDEIAGLIFDEFDSDSITFEASIEI
jgi:hypothetical protein